MGHGPRQLFLHLCCLVGSLLFKNEIVPCRGRVACLRWNGELEDRDWVDWKSRVPLGPIDSLAEIMISWCGYTTPFSSISRNEMLKNANDRLPEEAWNSLWKCSHNPKC